MTSSINEIVKHIKDFRDARDWEQFHTLQNLITSLNLEAAELLELTQWKTHEAIEKLPTDSAQLDALKSECADILIYLLLISDRCGIDILDAVKSKISLNETRYPVDKAKGTATKYNKL